MTRYLLATWEGGGNVPPELGLARELLARGHSVRVVADPAVEPAARAAGCEFSSWRTAPMRHTLARDEDIVRDWDAENVMKAFVQTLDRIVCGPAARFAADTLAVLAEHPADVVLVDMMLLGGALAAESAQLPHAFLVPNISVRPAKGVPALGPGFLPARGPLGRLRDSVVRHVSMRMWAKGLPAINRARAELALPPVHDIWQIFDRADRVCIMTSPSFDFVASDLPPNTRYVGPILEDPSWAPTTWTPPWSGSNTDPLVLVGLSSTYQQQQEPIRRVIEALSPLPVRALVTLGPALDTESITSSSPNVVVVPGAPHALVLPHAALAITHCGHGTTLRALSAGVPLVCMPMGRDQNDTAARVVAREAGVRIKPTASVTAIRRAVETVLRDPRYLAGARALRDTLEREAATNDAAGAIEQVSLPASRRAS